MSGGDGQKISLSRMQGEAGNPCWYAVHTRPHREKVVAHRLESLGLATYLPLATEVHQWSDREKVIEVPLFSSYVFVQLVMNRATRLQVLTDHGVLNFVGFRGQGIPIPEEQIDAVRMLVSRGIACSPLAFVAVGQRVRVRGGALDGIEGTLLSRNQNDTLVVSIDVLGRSLGVSVAGYQVEALQPNLLRSELPMPSPNRFSSEVARRNPY